MTSVGPCSAGFGLAERGYVETPFGAPVVRDVLADPGLHERLMTAREVAARLGVCTALIYRLCQRNELLALRIGGALRLHRETVASFVGRPSGDCQEMDRLTPESADDLRFRARILAAIDSGALRGGLGARVRSDLGFRLRGPSPISGTRGVDRGGCPRNEHIDECTHLRWQ